MHKWLEHLTHTNIHISLEEKIPQGWDGAICVRQTEHKENRPQSAHTHKNLFKCKKMLKLSRGWQHLGDASLDLSQTITFKLIWEPLHTRWSFSHCYKLVKCHVHTRGSEMLSRWVGLCSDTALGNLMKGEKPGGPSCDHWLQTTASRVIISTIAFIHEPNKAESVLKAFTVRSRAHE